MSIRIGNFGRLRGGARGGSVRSTIALAVAGAAALVAPAANAGAPVDRPNVASASSYDFDDSLWTNVRLKRPATLSPLAEWAPRCFVNCGPAFGTYVVRRSELLRSNTPDVSVNRAADPTGHAVGVSGTILAERLETDSFGAETDWVVVSERTLDSNGSHSWSLLSGVPSDAPWPQPTSIGSRARRFLLTSQRSRPPRPKPRPG